MLEKVRLALRITTTEFDEELSDLIEAALLDLGVAGVTNTDTTDALICRAVISYVRMDPRFCDTGSYSIWKACYDEQKAQLSMCSDYTTF